MCRMDKEWLASCCRAVAGDTSSKHINKSCSDKDLRGPLMAFLKRLRRAGWRRIRVAIDALWSAGAIYKISIRIPKGHVDIGSAKFAARQSQRRNSIANTQK
jgi:hypothetical protein